MSMPMPWRGPVLTLALGWTVLAVLYFSTGAAMVEIWNRSETFAHAWVVPPISAWLVWRMRGQLAGLSPQPSPTWLLLLLPLGLLWLVGDIAAANAATQFALMGMAVVLVPAILGKEVAGRMAFALGFLFFAVPFGDFLTPWLVERTADFTVVALRATGIPVFREGTQFIIPTGAWSVVQACSGIRYLMASVMVGTLFAYLNYSSNRKRWIFVAVAILTPLAANWLRAYMIVMLGHLSGNRLAVGVDHIIYGWVFFGIIMLVMFMLGARWADPDAPTAPDSGSAGGRTAAAWATPGSLRGYAFLAAALCLVAAPVGARWFVKHSALHGQPFLEAPVLPGWRWVPEPATTWQPHFVSPSAALHGRYESETAPGVSIGLYVGYYRDQRPGHKLVTSVNELANAEEDKDWSITSTGRGRAAGQDWRTAELRGAALSVAIGTGNAAPRLRAWHLYWINGKPWTSDWLAKLYGAWQSLLGKGDDAAVLILYADKAGGGADDAQFKAFIERHWPALDEALRRVRDRDANRKQ